MLALGGEVDVYVPEDSGLNGSARETLAQIKAMDYSTGHRFVAGTPGYNVLLECYPLSDFPSMHGIDYDYRLKFPYFLLAAKPSSSYIPELHLPYDATIAFSAYEAEVFKAYGRSHFVKPPNFAEFAKNAEREGSRERLLYLPTFNDKITDDYAKLGAVFERLKERFHLVVKMHSATQFSEEEAPHREFLASVADECLDQSANLVEVLQGVDVVLSGNSAAVFDALYAEVPVCVASQDVNRFRLLTDTPLQQFVSEGAIPLASTLGGIEAAIAQALDLAEAQRALRQREFFPQHNPPAELTAVIRAYCETPAADDPYTQLRRHYLAYREGEVQAYEQSLSWRVGSPLRWVLDRFTQSN